MKEKLKFILNQLNNAIVMRYNTLIFLVILGCAKTNDQLNFANGFSDSIVKSEDNSEKGVQNIIYTAYDQEENYMGELILDEKRDTLYFEDQSLPKIVIRQFYENNMISRKEESVLINDRRVSNLKKYYKQGRVDTKTSSFLEVHNEGDHFEVCFSVPGCDSAYFFKSNIWPSAYDMDFNHLKGEKTDNNCFNVIKLDDTKGVIVLYKTLKSDSTGTDIAKMPIYVNADILRSNIVK